MEPLPLDQQLHLLCGRVINAKRPGFIAIDDQDTENIIYLDAISQAWLDHGDLWLRIDKETVCFRDKTAELIWRALTSALPLALADLRIPDPEPDGDLVTFLPEVLNEF